MVSDVAAGGGARVVLADGGAGSQGQPACERAARNRLRLEVQHAEHQQVVDRALLHRQGAVHVSLADGAVEIEGDLQGGGPPVQPDRHGRQVR